MTPGAIFSIVFGLWLWFGYGISGKWLMWKLVAVLFLMAFHAWCFVQMRAFAAGRNTLTERTFRILNELPVFALFAIVILVVVKPF
jgi:putative membrane protein